MTDAPDKLQSNNYSEKDIIHLEGVAHVRKRPGMYVGGTDIKALHHLVYEVVDNSVDEALAGRASMVEVTLHTDGSVSVRDDGAGIPVGEHTSGISTLELVMTKIGAGGKFENDAYKVSGGLHGVGVSAVNALSSLTRVTVRRNGKEYLQEYQRGIPATPVEVVRELEPDEGTGTTVRFVPDHEIFPERDFSYDTLVARFREVAFLVSGITIRVIDERIEPLPREITFYFEGGLKSFVRYLNRNRKALHDIIYAEREVTFNEDDPKKRPLTVGVEIALQYTDASTTTELSFANTINTPDGGTHNTGMRGAITRTINLYAKNSGILKERDSNFSSNDTLEGLTAIVSIKHPDPQFESQTKVKLMNPEMNGAVSQVLTDVFSEFMETNSKDARRIIDKCMLSKRARDAAAKARDLVRSNRGNLLENTTLPGKLADCSTSNPDEAEIYIVEGDSAGGSAKQGRDRHFQAILPLRGKILNTERARLDKILDNNEVRALISALGVGIGDDFNLEKLRYKTVIIMTDADVDGSHITTLLLTFFFRYMTPLIQAGHLYIAQPPLYRVQHKRNIQYAYSDQERDEIIAGFNGNKVGIQRYKGLGEMNPDQLWETTMNPENRVLLQVTIEDLSVADHTFDMLMGSAVPPRKRFIQTHAKNVRNLDI